MSGEGVQGRSLLAGGDAEVAVGGGQILVFHEGVDDATVDTGGQEVEAGQYSVAGGEALGAQAIPVGREDGGRLCCVSSGGGFLCRWAWVIEGAVSDHGVQGEDAAVG